MRTKFILMMVSSVLLATVIYSSSSGFEACAAQMDPNFGEGICTWDTDPASVTCCWVEILADGNPHVLCQKCYTQSDGSLGNCDNTWFVARPTSVFNLTQLQQLNLTKQLPSVPPIIGNFSDNDMRGPNLGSEADLPPFRLPDQIPVQPEEDKGTDSKSGSESPSPKVTIIKNQEPDADAGLDINVYEGQSFALDGTASSDPDGDKLAFSWSQKSPSSPTIPMSNPETSTPKFIAPQVGKDTTLTFTLKVGDGNGGEDTDDVKVTVLNKAAVKKPVIE